MDTIQQRLEQQPLQDILSAPTITLVPESLTDTLATALIVMSGVTVVIALLFLVGTIRKWKVQSAVLKMQKDVAEIKQALERDAPASRAQATTTGQSRKVEVTTE